MRFLVVAAVYLTASLNLAQAEEQTSYYIGVHDIEFPPFSWLEQGQLQGLDRDVLDAFANKQEFKLVYVPLPRVRALTLLRQGQIDALYPDDKGWAKPLKGELGLTLTYSEAAVRNQSGLFMLKRYGCSSKISDIGTLLGWVVGGYQEQEQKGLVTVHRFATVDQALEAGLKAEVDAVYAGRAFLEHHTSKHPTFSVFEFCNELPSMYGSSRLSSFRRPELISRFNNFLEEHSELMRDIRSKHIPQQ